jgi:DNA-binding transcriptional regulator PaaX
MHPRLEFAAGLGEGVVFLSRAVARLTWRIAVGPPPAERELRNLRRTLGALENQGLVAREGGGTWRLTAPGRALVHGGVHPPVRWDRPWNGRWHCLVFDLPERERGLRMRLHRLLRRHRLGFLQQSVWVSPDPLPNLADFERPGVGTLLTFELRPNPGTTDGEIVTEAWDFAVVNRAYSEWQTHCRRCPLLEPGARSGGANEDWLEREKELWRGAVSSDPFLPRTLLPDGYLGVEAWTERLRFHARIARKLGSA